MSATVSCMSITRDRRRRALQIAKMARAANTSQKRTHPTSGRPPITLAFRGHRLVHRDLHVRYDAGVGERSVDRKAWAAVISQLVTEETGGNRSRFAALVGVTYKTVTRWLKGETDVSEESVRQVARAVHVPPAELLVRVGYYKPEELAQSQPVETEDDPAMRVIMEADVPPRVKQRMIERLRELRKREVEEVQWWIDQARGA